MKRLVGFVLLVFSIFLLAGCKSTPAKSQQSDLLKALKIRPEDILDIQTLNKRKRIRVTDGAAVSCQSPGLRSGNR